jgi:Flp pilus assembly protein TadD
MGESLMDIYQKQKQYEAALSRYNNTLEKFAYDTNALVNRGEMLLRLGRFQEAEEDFQQAIQLDPKGKDPAGNRARLLVNMVQDARTIAREEGLEVLEEIKKQRSE